MVDFGWVDKALSTARLPRCWSRPLRMASDCSGIGTPELAWAQLRERSSEVPAAMHAFMCDISPSCRKWLRKVLPGVTLFDDISTRTFTSNTLTGRTASNSMVALERDTLQLDLCIAGFMCSPCSPRGKGQGFQDKAAASGNYLGERAADYPRTAQRKFTTRVGLHPGVPSTRPPSEHQQIRSTT